MSLCHLGPSSQYQSCYLRACNGMAEAPGTTYVSEMVASEYMGENSWKTSEADGQNKCQLIICQVQGTFSVPVPGGLKYLGEWHCIPGIYLVYTRRSGLGIHWPYIIYKGLPAITAFLVSFNARKNWSTNYMNRKTVKTSKRMPELLRKQAP